MMRRLLPLLFLLACGSAFAKNSEAPEGPPPPPLADAGEEVDEASLPAPDIRIIDKGDTTIAEYRINGRLYMVRVTPRIGPPYYLIDETGNGQMVRRDGPDPGFTVPRWVLFRW